MTQTVAESEIYRTRRTTSIAELWQHNIEYEFSIYVTLELDCCM